MKRLQILAIPAVTVLLGGMTMAQLPGSPLPEPRLTGFTGTPVTSLEEYMGRTLLLEFFSYW